MGDYCYLTTTGRVTGRPHRIEIWFAADGDTLYLLAGGGRRTDWVRNIDVRPEIAVELEGQVRSGVARVINGGEEVELARSKVFEKYAPSYGGDLTSWRETALPVAVDLVPNGAAKR